MALINDSQDTSDALLWHALRNVEKGFYYDCGTHLSDEHRLTSVFGCREWRGINVEPKQQLSLKIIWAWPHHINLGIAIGKEEATVDPFIIPDSEQTVILSDFARNYENIDASNAGIEMPCLKLSALWRKNVPSGQKVHFSKTYAEEIEEGVLFDMDWAKYRRWVLVLENNFKGSLAETDGDWKRILLNASYVLAYQGGLGRFHVVQEHCELIPPFSATSNVLDSFEHSHLNEVAEEIGPKKPN